MIPRNVRLGEAPSYGLARDPPRPALRRLGGLLRAGEGGGGPWLSARAAWAAGWRRSCLAADAEAASTTDELRDFPLELIAPNPRQPRQHFDEDALLALAESLASAACSSRSSCARSGGTFELIAGERRCAPRRSRDSRLPRSSAPRDDAESLELALIENMAREDLNPIEEARACAAPRRGARPDARGGRPPRRPHARGGHQPAAAARPPRRGARAARRGRVDRGPRPRAAAGADQATAAACPPPPRGWSVREPEARARDAGPRPRRAGRARPAASDHEAAARRLRTRCRGARQRREGTPRGDGYRVVRRPPD